MTIVLIGYETFENITEENNMHKNIEIGDKALTNSGVGLPHVNKGIGYRALRLPNGNVENPCDLDKHEKVYSINLTGGIQRWICSKCGLMGEEPFDWEQTWSEYARLVKKFHGN